MFINSFLTRFKVEFDLHKVYEVKDLLGKGGHGEVYSGVRRKDGKKVAIKRIKKRNSEKRKRRKLPSEVSILQQLQDVPGVVPLLDYHQSEGSHYIVMERFACQDMFDFISEHPSGVAENVAREMFKQIVETVQHCRKKGFVHGDIKDENMLINTETKEIKLIDFGSSDHWSEEVLTRFGGTRDYAPPEWFSAGKITAEGLTVWSLGILLYSFLCGDIPFQTDLHIRQEKITLPPTISQAAASLVQRCLEKNPGKRITLTDLSRDSWLLENGDMDRYTDRYFVTKPVFV